MRLSIDLGGTNVRIAQVDNGVCIQKLSEPCLATEEADVVVNQLIQLIEKMMTPEVDGIGIGVPSIVDTQRGIVYNVANIPSWKEVHLKEILEKRFNVAVAVNNDCNCFALGISLYGEGGSFRNLVAITLGTGVGAGVMVERQLYSGRFAGAGEVGCLPYKDSDFEHYCSSFFFKKHHTSGAAEAEKALKGDLEAIALWEEFGYHLGQLIKAILYTYAPHAVIIGGGIAPAFPLFQEAMNRSMDDFPYTLIREKVKVLPTNLKDANLLGAASLL